MRFRSWISSLKKRPRTKADSWVLRVVTHRTFKSCDLAEDGCMRAVLQMDNTARFKIFQSSSFLDWRRGQAKLIVVVWSHTCAWACVGKRTSTRVIRRAPWSKSPRLRFFFLLDKESCFGAPPCATWKDCQPANPYMGRSRHNILRTSEMLFMCPLGKGRGFLGRSNTNKHKRNKSFFEFNRIFDLSPR